MNFDNLVKNILSNAIKNIRKIFKPSNSICSSCQQGKKSRSTFKTKTYYSKRPLELLHTNHYGPMRITGLNGERYFILFIDEFSRIAWVALLKENSEAFYRFKVFREIIENKTRKE